VGLCGLTCEASKREQKVSQGLEPFLHVRISLIYNQSRCLDIKREAKSCGSAERWGNIKGRVGSPVTLAYSSRDLRIFDLGIEADSRTSREAITECFSHSCHRLASQRASRVRQAPRKQTPFAQSRRLCEKQKEPRMSRRLTLPSIKYFNATSNSRCRYTWIHQLSPNALFLLRSNVGAEFLDFLGLVSEYFLQLLLRHKLVVLPHKP
jgi:hypothetical protein